MATSPHFLTHLKTKRTVVFGGGVTGSSLKEFLEKYAASVVVVDEKSSDPGVVNEFSAELAAQTDVIVVSPGWRTDHPFIHCAQTHDIPVMSEIDLAWKVKQEVAPAQQWVGLTGTNGKTTTVQMVASIFAAGHINGVACGNIGEPVLTAVLHQPPYDYLALELSSFQLEWSHQPHFVAGAILNIADDHLDWHGSFDNYVKAKAKLLQFSSCAIVNADDAAAASCVVGLPMAKVRRFTLATPRTGEVGLVENLLIDRAFNVTDEAEVLAELSDIKPAVPHNVANALAAGALARALGISAADVQAGIHNFKLDHHRLETIAVHHDITWINDSKATNPHAALAALQSQMSAIWIAGGLAKGASMDELIQRGHSRIKAAILIGTDAPLIEGALMKYAPQITRIRINDGAIGSELMEKVVTQAAALAQPGDTVLLAPACASMDQFTSYADRGNTFTEAVKKLVTHA